MGRFDNNIGIKIMSKEKSIAKGILEERPVEEDFILLCSENNTDEPQELKHKVAVDHLQFHFCLEGTAEFMFNGGNYSMHLKNEHSFILYNPNTELPIHALTDSGTSLISLLIPIRTLHAFFSKESQFIDFLNDKNRDKKYYKERPISPSWIIVLRQILEHNLHPVICPIYYRAKGMELLSLYFNAPQDIDIEQCPFLVDERNMAKIRLAKEIVIEKMANPPTLQELSNEILLPLNRLKEGFKQVYGNTVFGFLLEYKMERARQLLASGSLNVNEVGQKLGYSSSSHFIAAFKREFGTTPKRYAMSLTQQP